MVEQEQDQKEQQERDRASDETTEQGGNYEENEQGQNTHDQTIEEAEQTLNDNK